MSLISPYLNDSKTNTTIRGQTDTKLRPLTTVKGLSFSTDDKTGNVENLDQKMFWNLKLMSERVVIKQSKKFEHKELCDLH